MSSGHQKYESVGTGSAALALAWWLWLWVQLEQGYIRFWFGLYQVLVLQFKHVRWTNRIPNQHANVQPTC